VVGFTSASTRLSDGRIVVSDAQANSLKFYSPSGEYLKSVGGPGDGPGEFSRIGRAFRVHGDTLVVRDTRRPRLTYFDADGQRIRTSSIEPIDERVPRFTGFLRGTDYEVLQLAAGFSPPRETGVRRDTTEIVIRSSESSRVQRIGRFPGVEWFDEVSSDHYSTWFLPFTRGLHMVAGDSLLWIGSSDEYELRGYDVEGALTHIVRLEADSKPVSAADQERFFNHQISSAETEMSRDMWQRGRGFVTTAPTYPAFAGITVDQEGYLWVKEYDAAWSDDPPTWRVFTEEGVAIAIVHLPRDLQVHEIGKDYVLGRWEDALDVHHVQLLRLTRK
jgi:hypothetical protein